VIVAASGPHRQETFAGARAVIDRLKEQAPIFKREPDGWVEGTLPGRMSEG
jgi:molybdopterin synthase catalytic subunit